MLNDCNGEPSQSHLLAAMQVGTLALQLAATVEVLGLSDPVAAQGGALPEPPGLCVIQALGWHLMCAHGIDNALAKWLVVVCTSRKTAGSTCDGSLAQGGIAPAWRPSQRRLHSKPSR